jgi:hypothetical protein
MYWSSLMADPALMLATLRDIHWPAGSGGAPLFVTMLIGSTLAVALSVALWPKMRRWRAVRRSALAALSLTRGLDPAERLGAQAVLLRRLVRTIAGEDAARRQGADWLECLDRLFATRFFTEGEGRTFGEALYQPLSDQDVDALDAALARLFARIAR